MSSHNYAMFELKIDLKKILTHSDISKAYDKMMLLAMEEDLDSFQIESGDGSIDFINAQTDFIDQVNRFYSIIIYPRYISSEAEDTDKAGEVIWCTYPALDRHVQDVANKWESWVEFG